MFVSFRLVPRLPKSLSRRSNIIRARTSALLPCRNGRRLSTTVPPSSQGTDSRIRVSALFTVLLCIGVGATTLGLYQLYTTMTMWPPELRKDLRAGLAAKSQGNLDLSEKYLRRALETARNLPVKQLNPDPYLKISGIAISLAGVLEAHDLPAKAYEVYVDALAHLQGVHVQLNGAERLRAVAIACKLGEIAEIYQQPPEEEEKWLVWAVEEVLKMLRDESTKGSVIDPESQVMITELDLPNWVSRTDVGAPLEALGAFYARVGNVEYAMPLYLQAISLLIPPSSPQDTSSEDLCRGAQLMNNLSELIMRKPTAENMHQAEAWAKQSLSLLQKTKATTGTQVPICEQALAVAFFNLGSLREMSGDRVSSRELFTAGLEQSKIIGLKEGITEARLALRRLDRKDRAADRHNPLLDDPITDDVQHIKNAKT